MNAILNEKFFSQTSESEGQCDPYTVALEIAVGRLSHLQPTIVLDSQQWSKQAAYQTGATIYSAAEWAALDSIDSDELGGAWVVYSLNSVGEWDLAWVATWPNSPHGHVLCDIDTEETLGGEDRVFADVAGH